MKMTPLNIGLLVAAILAGLYLGIQYPTLGLLLFIPVIIFVVVVLMRNKSGALADEAATADAKAMKPAEGKARIYAMRDGFVGGQQGMIITIDDELTSQIRSKYFLMAEVDPGQHRITAKLASGNKQASQSVELAAGDIVLFDIKLNMGMVQGTPDLTEIRDAREANGMISNLKMVEWK